MLHAFLLLFSFYLIGLGLVICVVLFQASIKAKHRHWFIVFPAILLVAFLDFNFACHIFHLSAPIPHQKQINSTIRRIVDWAFIPLLAIKLYELYIAWRKKRRPADVPPTL